MADTKTSALTEATDIATDDLFMLVDTSAGATKKVTGANHLLPLGKVSPNSPWRTGTPCLYYSGDTNPGDSSGWFAFESDPNLSPIETRIVLGWGDLSDPLATVFEVSIEEVGAFFDMYRWGSANGECRVALSETEAQFYAKGVNGQTAALLQLKSNDSAVVFQVMGDKKVGFFGADPVVQAAAPTTLAHVITILTNLGVCAA